MYNIFLIFFLGIPSCPSPGDNSPPVARRPRNLELLTSPVIQFKEKEKKAKSYKSSSPNPLEILEELVATLKKGSEKSELFSLVKSWKMLKIKIRFQISRSINC